MQQDQDRPRQRARRTNAAIAAVGAVLALALWSVVELSVHFAREDALARAKSNAANLAGAFSDEVGHTMDTVGAAMDLLAGRMREKGEAFNLAEWSAEIPMMAAGAIQAAIIAPNGELVATTLDPHPPPTYLGDREHFRVHLDDPHAGMFIGPPVVGRISKQTTIQVTKRVDAADGRFLGVLLFSLAPGNLTSLHRSVDLGERGVLSLTGLDGVIRARFTRDAPDGLAGSGASIPDRRRPMALPEGAAGDFIRASTFDGVTRLFSYRRVPHYPLVVTVGLDLADALAAPAMQQRVLVALAAAATLLFAGLAAVLVREINRRAASAAALTESEARLRRSEEHLARAQRVAQTGSFERDLATGAVEWSEETYRIFGRDRGSPPLTRDEFLLIVHPEDRAKYAAVVHDSEEGKPVPPVEYRVIFPDGGVRWICSESEVVLGPEGTPERRVGTCRDVTAIHEAQEELRRSTEQQLLHTQRLEALGTLAGGVAHDLNNMLVPILALSKMALKELPEASKARMKLETISSAGERARDLVKQILVFGRKHDALVPVDLARLAHDSVQMMRAGLPPTIEIVEEIGAVPTVMGDAGQLHQVILNLITNAGHAIGAVLGRITVRLDAGLAGDDPSSTIRLAVADTGCGMSEATVARIFEPFFTTKRAGSGTGLGLALVHGIVESHHGRIDVASQLGHGTEFIVTLPGAAEAAPAAPVTAVA